jgi:Ca-activated chloride channel family protein
VIDRSLSMGPSGALAAVKRELLASLGQLPDDVRFQIVFYNRQAEPLIVAGSIGMIAATTNNKQAVARQIESLAAEGGTEHLPAFSRALAFEPDVIYFLTDADDLRPEQVRQMTLLNHGRTVVHAIELSTANADRSDMPLHVLARENRRTYRAVAVR